MAKFKRILVDMPNKKISFTKANKNGTIYVKYLVSSKRISNDYVKHERVHIGTKDLESGKLIPNDNYYKYFKGDAISRFSPNKILDYGNYYLLYKIASKHNLLNILKSQFPNNWNKIITAAMYMVSEGSVMYYCEDWCDETFTIENTKLYSSSITELFKSITVEERHEFFKEWVKSRFEDECIAYDSTSISSYGRNLVPVEYGYNKDKEKLPQINYGMFYGQESKLPLFYEVYNGSLTDKEHFISMLRYSKTFNINKVHYCMDRGYFKKTNIEYLYNNQIPFIMGASLHLVDIKKAFKEMKQRIQLSENVLDQIGVYGVNKDIELFKIPLRLHLYFSFDKQAEQIIQIDTKIKELEEELKNKNKLDNTERYDKYFEIVFNKDGTFTYAKKYNIIDEEKTTAGFFAILSSRLDYSTSMILLIYRMKDWIEKTFDDLKNYIDLNRLRIHSKDTMEGKMFIAFISLILKSQIGKVISDEINNGKLTVEKVLKELAKIKLTTLHSQDTIMLALTKKQKDILKKFDIHEDEMKKSIFQMHL